MSPQENKACQGALPYEDEFDFIDEEFINSIHFIEKCMDEEESAPLPGEYDYYEDY